MQHITCKLGNMRRAAQFLLYPRKSEADTVTIQSDSRIAQVNLTTGKTWLSSGKGGRYGNTFLHLSPVLGAVEVDCLGGVEEVGWGWPSRAGPCLRVKARRLGLMSLLQ